MDYDDEMMDTWMDEEAGEYLDLGEGGVIGAGGIPGTTAVANSGTGVPAGTGGNIPSANSRRKKKRLVAGGGPSLGDPTTKGGYQESIGKSGF